MGGVHLKQIRVRWGDLGSPLEAGTYPCGPHIVEVTPGDIKLAEGNPDAVFTAIHPDFYSDETPYLLTGVELPGPYLGANPEQPLTSSAPSSRRSRRDYCSFTVSIR
jgi:hypothetical protein